MALAEVVANAQTGHLGGDSFANVVDAEELRYNVARRVRAFVGTVKRDLRHRQAQHASANGVSLGVIRVEEILGRGALDHLRELPSEIHCILHTGVETLSTDG